MVPQIPSAVGVLGRLEPNLLKAIIRNRGTDLLVRFKTISVTSGSVTLCIKRKTTGIPKDSFSIK